MFVVVVSESEWPDEREEFEREVSKGEGRSR